MNARINIETPPMKRSSTNRLSIVGIGPGNASLRTLAQSCRKGGLCGGCRPYLELINDYARKGGLFQRHGKSGQGPGGGEPRPSGSVALVAAERQCLWHGRPGPEMAEHPADVEVVPGCILAAAPEPDYSPRMHGSN